MYNWSNKFGFLTLVIGLIIFIIQDDFTHDKTSFTVGKHVQNSEVFEATPISLAELLMFMKKNQTICIDMRKRRFFNNGHIPKAINIPGKDFVSQISPQRLEKFKKAFYIILYTTSDRDELGKGIKSYLFKKGIKDIYFYNGGWNEWKACNMPVERENDE